MGTPSRIKSPLSCQVSSMRLRTPGLVLSSTRASPRATAITSSGVRDSPSINTVSVVMACMPFQLPFVSIPRPCLRSFALRMLSHGVKGAQGFGGRQRCQLCHGCHMRHAYERCRVGAHGAGLHDMQAGVSLAEWLPTTAGCYKCGTRGECTTANHRTRKGTDRC